MAYPIRIQIKDGPGIIPDHSSEIESRIAASLVFHISRANRLSNLLASLLNYIGDDIHLSNDSMAGTDGTPVYYILEADSIILTLENPGDKGGKL